MENKENTNSYQDLNAWKKSMDLTVEIYKVSALFPSLEVYGLTSQIRRCAVSIPSNIAEGVGRNTTKDTLKFLYISRGSIYELETQLIVALRLDYVKNDSYQLTQNLLTECIKLLRGIINYFKKKLTEENKNNKNKN